MSDSPDDLLSLTAGIVAAYVSRQAVTADALPGLMRTVRDGLVALQEPAPTAVVAKPDGFRLTATEIRKSMKPDALIKSDALRRKIVQAPFYANDIGLGAKFSPTSAITVGGLVVDEDTGEVLSSDGGKVPGLYAAGRTAIGICSHYYVSGLSLGDCVW